MPADGVPSWVSAETKAALDLPWDGPMGPDPMSGPDPRVGLALLVAGRYGWRSTNGASAPRKRRSRWVAQAAKGAGGKG